MVVAASLRADYVQKSGFRCKTSWVGVFSSAVFSNNIARFLKFGERGDAYLFFRPLFGSKMQNLIFKTKKSKTYSSNNIARLEIGPFKNVP